METVSYTHLDVYKRQVSVNDLVMIVAFAPIAAFLLGVTDVTVPWETLLLSTILYVVLPLAAGMLTRRALAKRSPHAAVSYTHLDVYKRQVSAPAAGLRVCAGWPVGQSALQCACAAAARPRSGGFSAHRGRQMAAPRG